MLANILLTLVSPKIHSVGLVLLLKLSLVQPQQLRMEHLLRDISLHATQADSLWKAACLDTLLQTQYLINRIIAFHIVGHPHCNCHIQLMTFQPLVTEVSIVTRLQDNKSICPTRVTQPIVDFPRCIVTVVRPTLRLPLLNHLTMRTRARTHSRSNLASRLTTLLFLRFLPLHPPWPPMARSRQHQAHSRVQYTVMESRHLPRMLCR